MKRSTLVVAALLAISMAALHPVPTWAGGLLGDIANAIVPGSGDVLDQAHDEIKHNVPIYSDIEEGASGAVRHVIDEATAQTLAPEMVAYLEASRQAALSDGVQPIPQHIRQSLTGFVPENVLNTARYRVGGGGDLSLQQMSFKYGDAVAIVLIDVIVFSDQNDSQFNLSLWAHELKHVEQFASWGVYDFALRYIRDSQSVEGQAEQNSRDYVAWSSVQIMQHGLPSTGSNGMQSPLAMTSLQQSGSGNMCQTAMGSCSVNGVAPAGTSCWCKTVYGANVGSIVPEMSQQSQRRLANVCAPFAGGMCQLGQPVEEGGSCACYNAFGAYPGMAQVNNMPVPPPPPTMSNICHTPAGMCPMPGFGPAGAPCWCPTMMGPIGGSL